MKNQLVCLLAWRTLLNPLFTQVCRAPTLHCGLPQVICDFIVYFLTNQTHLQIWYTCYVWIILLTYLPLRIIQSNALSPFLTPQWSWSCSRTLISRYYKTGKDKRSTLNMATRCMLRTVLNSFVGLKLGHTNVQGNVQKWINVPRIGAATIQCRGIRQGDVIPEM